MIPFGEIPMPPETIERVERLGRDIARLASDQHQLLEIVKGEVLDEPVSRLTIFQGYIGVFIVAFLVTMLATPVIRRLAISQGVIDRPNEARKIHSMPIAYLGGVAVFLGLMAGIFYSYAAIRFPVLLDFHPTEFKLDGYAPFPVPPWVALGMTVIVLVGFIDDVHGISPRVKLGGQLFAAAALAIGDIGVKLAAGVLTPTLGRLLDNPELVYTIGLPAAVPLLGDAITIDFIYWTGTAVIAIFVLGACNAANFIDGLDGLLTGTTAIATVGFLIIALGLAVMDDGPLDASRVVICLAVLGACLGFLPHNFNPATIFLGDAGSLLLGYCAAIMILSLGDTGKTWLVAAGLIIYSIPIIDTMLAIIRRKLAGKRISDPDADHLHHMLKRWAGVKGAVLTLYGMGIVFATLGVLLSLVRGRFVYALALLFASYIAVYAIKIARRKHLEEQMLLSLGGEPPARDPVVKEKPREPQPPGVPKPAPAAEP
ncbi:MAG: undecaprenyl/decaprenyl-phosphate alpha-N-acetylglucosaminyl 1-phosphate transferase [Phycisphaerales bacterium]|nr:undecaprenyl/decaprenyl-phosphate alpha-N-acetylglucosaminyl 1-phosphate transferase [Planctomycetota bacterium]MCH8509464.1 undecaprenyl/decaprenyl-phosphate alpha-N-acetylglucosaminyl 1-phosphate transferase [Phycisphaerales bacterium]